MKTDRAIVNYGPEPYSVDLREIPVATIDDDQVLLEVQSVGVCGSDLHMWTAQQSWAVNYPVVLGHEFCGIIRQVGKNVRRWREGDRVVSETAAIIDADSPLTRQGLYNLDPGRRGYGAMTDGAMRSFVPVPARILHGMPEGMTFDEAALTEPSCVAYSAVVSNARIRPGDRIAVLGPGPIGILCAAIARLTGAEVGLVGLDRDRVRLDAGAAYGCTPLIDNLKEWAFEIDGLGVDGVVDATGVSSSLNTALEIVRPAGWISKVGWGPQPLDFSIDRLVQKNVTLQGSFSHNWSTWERVIRLIATKQLDVGPITGGAWPLTQWQTAFEKMHSGEIVKAILKPSLMNSNLSHATHEANEGKPPTNHKSRRTHAMNGLET
ncbi:MAG TPA: zinc-binding dehydrogenase [Lacipirellulaceae bacterium]|nr:zinc-binding dehydrogenase [Lacipirellulaceae bacterium]